MRLLAAHERAVFALATLAGIVHGVDEIASRADGYLRTVPVMVLSAGLVLGWPWVNQVLRRWAAVLFGLFWTGGVFTHWLPMADRGAVPGDWTSFVSVPGGILFLLLGATLLWPQVKRTTGDGTSNPGALDR